MYAIIFLVVLLLPTVNPQHFIKQQLNDDWKMIITSGPEQANRLINKQYNITVPSTIHLNLQQHKQIPDPFFGDNIRNLDWISRCQVKFETTIKITADKLRYSKIKLVFQGIDTYAAIYLNDVKLGQTKNAFLQYQFDVHTSIKAGDNHLVVKFNNTQAVQTEGQIQNKMPFKYAHTRKACYQYSWDWAPLMNTMGIWLPVSLNFYDQIKLDYIWIRNRDLNQQSAKLDIVISLDCDSTLDLSSKGIVAKIRRMDDGTQQVVSLKAKNSNTEIVIRHPKLWWPNNIGQPHVYQFQFYLSKANVNLDYKKVVYGIKTVKLDEQNNGFKIILNGYPIYCKGANYVPPDMMYPRLINPNFNSKYTTSQLLQDAVDSNFNMIRIWGGGQYETDQFYEMASRKGLMIFQDFMFSDSIYPASDQFLNNVRDQIVYQVRRLRNHPCIVLWSGNNQILQGIRAWGWGSPNYINNYEKVFKQLVPNIIGVEDNSIPYIQSSPSRGVGNGGFQNGGDIHYWGVWAGSAAFESYQTALGGFNSEFGTQSLPVWQSIKQFTQQQDRSYTSQTFLGHERHGSQFNILNKYMKMYSRPSLNFQLEAYSSGLVQAYGIQIAIRSQRLAKPISYGTLYWQFNDAWPAISWSSIDYYGRWKPLQYKAKTLFSDIILFYNPKDKVVTAINDKLIPIKAQYIIQAMTFDGKIISQKKDSVSLKEDDKKIILSLPDEVVNTNSRNILVYTEIIYGKHANNRTRLVTFHQPYKNLQINPAQLHVRYLFESNEIQLSCDYLIKSLMIGNSQQTELRFSDNYIDVVPNHPYKVKILSGQLRQLRQSMTYQSYRQVYDPQPLSIRFEN